MPNPSLIASQRSGKKVFRGLDDDIAILTKYLKTEGASEDVFQALETLSNEQHASWQAAVERIEELMA
jgi:hypothetical protein